MLVHSVSQHEHALTDAAAALRSNSHQHQELLRTDAAGTKGLAHEDRPLDAVNRHSRQVDMSPTLSATEGRRLSRLPSSLGPLDPFGYDVEASQTTPYDSAYAFTHSPQASSSQIQRTLSRSSVVLPTASTSSPQLAQQYSIPASSSMLSDMSAAATVTGAAVPGTMSRSPSHSQQYGRAQQPDRPWIKPRSASWGDQSAAGRASFKNGLSAPNNRSKLSGEIVAETMSVVELPVTTPSKIDYTSSRLYQRTLKAQKALEKDRAKAAAKGKVSKYDTPDLKTLAKQERRQSSASSFVSDVGVMANRSRTSLGWFRSSSEATLALPPSPTLQPGTGVSSSRSSTTLLSLSSAKGSPHLEPPTLWPTQKLKSVASKDRLREAREAVGAVSPPRHVAVRHQLQGPPHPVATAKMPLADVPVDRSELRPRQSSLMPASTLASTPNAQQPSRTPSPLSMAEVTEALMKTPQTDSAYVSCSSSKEPSLDHEQRADGSPSPPSSESSPSTPPPASIEVFALPVDTSRPSLPRSRKSSFNLFGRKVHDAPVPAQMQITPEPAKMTKSRSSFFGRSTNKTLVGSSSVPAPVPITSLETRAIEQQDKQPSSPARLTKTKSGFGTWFSGRTRSKSNPDTVRTKRTTEKALPPPPPSSSNRVFSAAVLRRG
ncbi:hypothetical protein OIV83_000271 [Microbotryomycetes sp. JL201]|nr:hypothetical protein OIV83_000271 [Microbotryomycetes sp. JL201]